MIVRLQICVYVYQAVFFLQWNIMKSNYYNWVWNYKHIFDLLFSVPLNRIPVYGCTITFFLNPFNNPVWWVVVSPFQKKEREPQRGSHLAQEESSLVNVQLLNLVVWPKRKRKSLHFFFTPRLFLLLSCPHFPHSRTLRTVNCPSCCWLRKIGRRPSCTGLFLHLHFLYHSFHIFLLSNYSLY